MTPEEAFTQPTEGEKKNPSNVCAPACIQSPWQPTSSLADRAVAASLRSIVEAEFRPYLDIDSILIS